MQDENQIFKKGKKLFFVIAALLLSTNIILIVLLTVNKGGAAPNKQYVYLIIFAVLFSFIYYGGKISRWILTAILIFSTTQGISYIDDWSNDLLLLVRIVVYIVVVLMLNFNPAISEFLYDQKLKYRKPDK